MNDLGNFNAVGRPRKNVTLPEIASLREDGLSWTEIASNLGICARTLRRRRLEMHVPEKYTTIENEQLMHILLRIHDSMPNAGERIMQGALQSRGIFIKRSRLRDLLNIIDREGRQRRRSRPIQRRIYNVKGPNHLWHLDTDHKLIAWRFVIHGCVDGFSRTILYVQCRPDNRADTALQCFCDGVSEFGIPSRVRGDHGVENFDVARLMLRLRGCRRGSFIAGRSVHNQRIEHMWGHVNRVVLTYYYQDLFKYMEAEGILDSTSELDLVCLHYVFLPRIQRSMDEVKKAWNFHPMRNERNMSPIALWRGGLRLGMDPSHLNAEMQEELQLFQDETPAIVLPDCGVIVPEAEIILQPHLIQLLRENIDPLQDDGNDGVTHFISCCELLHRVM